ncbi:CGNR zinc finger domain-containing protein [Streptomyces luteolus]|uniref:CGNR zinc finger domain-containing protein n=1 Tax=Streptomyces luteolus TaxID=3043615 RepID=A0ABT6T1B0_9ACTN|nr:CGNR zinc finger domain-containing protein [Streptomyces sp. B-S-A12]MDI3421178.1 CGNR zinc finger domain-containing protein [Streptomyces sp. B-S-A12]
MPAPRLVPDLVPDLVLDLALTVRHDGKGGIADDLDGVDGLARWVAARGDELAEAGAPLGDFVADEDALTAVRALRQAVRTLFARAVRPAPPSPADAQRLLPGAEALDRLAAAAARVPVAPRLTWPESAAPEITYVPTASGPPADLLLAALARAATLFLASDDRTRLRACHAPRCVRYFLKEHPRQEWCKPSCGNRARVARHHDRHRVESAL